MEGHSPFLKNCPAHLMQFAILVMYDAQLLVVAHQPETQEGVAAQPSSAAMSDRKGSLLSREPTDMDIDWNELSEAPSADTTPETRSPCGKPPSLPEDAGKAPVQRESPAVLPQAAAHNCRCGSGGLLGTLNFENDTSDAGCVFPLVLGQAWRVYCPCTTSCMIDPSGRVTG